MYCRGYHFNGTGLRASRKNTSNTCPRPAAGSTVTQPENLRSEDGVLKVELSYRNYLGWTATRVIAMSPKTGAKLPRCA